MSSLGDWFIVFVALIFVHDSCFVCVSVQLYGEQKTPVLREAQLRDYIPDTQVPCNKLNLRPMRRRLRHCGAAFRLLIQAESQGMVAAQENGSTVRLLLQIGATRLSGCTLLRHRICLLKSGFSVVPADLCWTKNTGILEKTSSVSRRISRAILPYSRESHEVFFLDDARHWLLTPPAGCDIVCVHMPQDLIERQQEETFDPVESKMDTSIVQDMSSYFQPIRETDVAII